MSTSPTQKWRLTAHALRRITERFGVDKSSAANWANQHRVTAEYVCNSLAEDGNYMRMFAKAGIVFFADLVDDVIFTAMRAEIKPPAVSAVAAAVAREVKRKELAVLHAEVEALAKRATRTGGRDSPSGNRKGSDGRSPQRLNRSNERR
ncbi:hypothetical protein D3C74_317300 [compost metagenome]